jgi:cytochrome c oxidase subunit 2
MPNLFLLAAVAGGPLENVSTLSPASPPAESIRFLFIFITAAAAFILAVVWGVLFYSLIRFRRKKHPSDDIVPRTVPTEPPQVYGSLPIEIAWTVAPGLIVLLLALVIVRTELEVRVNPNRAPLGAEPLRVSVVGHQWWWEYVIESADEQSPGIVTANELHVPVGDAETTSAGAQRPIYLTLQSVDVCHSFWLPRLAGKTDLIPGRVTQAWFQPTETGLYLGQCAEYCGTQHAGMLLRVYADSPRDFTAWLANEAKPAVDDPLVRQGKQTFLAQSCVNCHTIRGTSAQGRFGPDLTHVAARKTIAAGTIELNRMNLRRWINDPQQSKPGCLMPAFGLSDQNVDQITDYLMSLR